MSGRLPALKALEVIRALEKAGFTVVRSAGSHHRLVHRDDPTRATTVPVHKGRDLPRPFLRAILKQARVTADEFRALL
jgi:predicted RNA binding protein YcfA (HicA-like mRNA interferase family)